MPDYDVIIIGCGPAGATLARLLDPSLKACVIDRTDVHRSPRKTCGGLLAPDAQKQLARYGLTLPKEILVSPQIFAVKTVDLETKAVRHYQRSYLNMDRLRFDSWLRSLIPENVEILDGACRSVSRTSDGFSVTYRQGDSDLTVTSKYIVGADGANSLVRRSLFPNVKIRQYIAIQRWYKDRSQKPFYSCIFDEKTTDCCSWSISKDGDMLYGGAFPFKNSKKLFETQLERAKEAGFEFGEFLFTEACLVNRPKRIGEIFEGENGAFLIGEAGGFISSSSLEGISWAMRTGECLAQSFNSPNPEKTYRKAVRPIKFKLWLKMRKCPFMYDPLLRRLVMASKIKSINVK